MKNLQLTLKYKREKTLHPIQKSAYQTYLGKKLQDTAVLNTGDSLSKY